MSSNIGHNSYRAYLSQPLLSGGSETTVYVDRITTMTGETMATADFSDLSYGVLVVNPDADGVTSFPEFISFTAIDSSAVSFTGAIRGLSSKSASVVTANKRFHPIGTPVVISWGVHSWKLLKDYVDTSVASFTSFFAPGTAGEVVSAGQLVYFDDTDNEWKLCDADTAATVENTMLGIAQGAGVDGGAITDGVLLFGYDDNQTGLTVGAIYYASNTAGAISSTPGTKEVTIGFSRSATTLYFNPRFNQQITEDQQDALDGNNGTPSSSNKFITQTGIQRGQEIYAADSVGSDSYAVTLSPIPTAYVTGMMINFKAGTTNTGAATLNVNSLGAKTIKKNNDQDLADGDIESGQIVTVIYDGTNFQMQSQTANSLSNKISLSNSNTTVSGTASETTLYTVSIPGGTLQISNGIRVKIMISDLDMANNPTNLIIRMKYGGTTIGAAQCTNITSGATNVSGYIEGLIVAAGTTSSQEGNIFWIVGEPNAYSSSTGTAAVDSTSNQDLVITAQFSTATGSSLTTTNVLVEQIR